MPDDTQNTQMFTKPDGKTTMDESHVGTITMRSIMAFVPIATVCVCAMYVAWCTKVIPDILPNLTIGVASYYFGGQAMKGQMNKTNPPTQ